MENIEIIENVSDDIVSQLDDWMFKTEGWSRIRGMHEMFCNGFEYYNFIVAFDKTINEAIGSISLSKDDSLDGNPEDVLYYIGGYYVRPEYRGTGVGRKLLDVVMEKTKGQNVTLNASLHLVDLYKRRGFNLLTEERNSFAMVDTSKIHLKDSILQGINIKDISEIDFSTVFEYDNTINGRSREKFLKEFLTHENSNTKVAVDTSSGRVTGICSIHPQYVDRLVVGPFYADSLEIAEALIHNTLSQVDISRYTHVIFKFPESNSGVKKILESLTEEPVEILAVGQTQFTKKLLQAETKKVFCVTETAHSYI